MKNAFLKFLEDCVKIGGKEGAAAILFELSREEMETNSKCIADLSENILCVT